MSSENVDLSKLSEETRAKVKRLIEPEQSFNIDAPKKSVERWKAAAKKSGQKIKDWAAIALDDAADGMPALLREARDTIMNDLEDLGVDENASYLSEAGRAPLRARKKLVAKIDLLLKGGR